MARLRGFWRKIRGYPPFMDHSRFDGDYEEWRERFADIGDGEKDAALKLAHELQKKTSFALIVIRRQHETTPDTDKILGEQLWKSIPHLLVDEGNGILPELLPQQEWMVVVDDEDRLRPYALLLLAQRIAEAPDAQVIYGDEEFTTSEGGLRPFFKPDWSPELYESTDYVGILAIRRQLLVAADELTPLAEVSARILGQASPSRVQHIPHVLAQRARASGAANAHERARSIHAFDAEQGETPRQVVIRSESTLYVQHDIPADPPRVSVIIPSRDRVKLLQACVESVLEKTVYDNFEIILLDNDSQEEATLAWFEEAGKNEKVDVHRYPHPFNFAAINNFGVTKATGDIFIFLNDDTTVISAAWMTELVRHAARQEIGAVGALLYYPDDTIQHAGVVCGISKAHIAGHIHRGAGRFDVPGLAGFDCVHNYSVVTGACLAVQREVFEKVDGFDEEFSVCYNDVDLCLRIKGQGYRNVWTPHSVLYHHENVSVAERNEEQAKVYDYEAGLMRSRYGTALFHDPAFNPNFALDGEGQVLAQEPRTRLPWRP